MIQSLRMVGGMFGTALVGTLVNHLYVSRVRDTLDAAHAAQWLPRLNDPQILINKAAQGTLVAELDALGQQGLVLIEAAREALVSSIHVGQMLSIAVAVLAVLQMRRVPKLQLRKRNDAAPPRLTE
jgi:hypothetical protein